MCAYFVQFLVCLNELNLKFKSTKKFISCDYILGLTASKAILGQIVCLNRGLILLWLIFIILYHRVKWRPS
jgi:hypothetical protein